MDIRRIVLFSALFFVGYTLMNTWRAEHPNIAPPSLVKGQVEAILPLASSDTPVFHTNETTIKTSQSPIIDVKTDVLKLKIDLAEGRIVEASLLNYPERAGDDKPFVLLDEHADMRYFASSQLYTLSENQVQPTKIHFTSKETQYEMSETQNQLKVELTGQNQEGLVVKKVFTFDKGSYLIQVDETVQNETDHTWTGYFNTQLSRTSNTVEKSSPFQVGSYTGASYSNPGVHRYQKVTFKDMAKSNLDATATGGWVAMQQRYFLTAWIPNVDSKNRFYTRFTSGEDYAIGTVSSSVALDPHAAQTFQARLYVGPEISETLSTIAPGLNLTVDYGWLWFISSMLFSVMKFIYQYVGNWGWAIVIVTALIKLAFYRLSATSYRSMAAMRKLQPKMQALKERYGDDKAKMSQATMELYRKEKVNPLSGCLPIIVQIPVMIALYWVLAESVEFRLSPFIFWITDLASSDPWHVLPILMGITMLIQQKLNPAPPDPMQAKMMMFLPVLMTGLFWNFPSGLVLYWTVNNTLTILQQWYITRQYHDEKPKKA